MQKRVNIVSLRLPSIKAGLQSWSWTGTWELGFQEGSPKSLIREVLWAYFFFFWLFRAASVAYGRSQTRDGIRATATGLYHSHSDVGSELCLWPTPQLKAMLDPHWARPGFKPATSCILVRFISAEPWWELLSLNFCTNSIVYARHLLSFWWPGVSVPARQTVPRAPQ